MIGAKLMVEVNVNVEKLISFGDYVEKFCKDTQLDCEGLQGALKQLQSHSSSEEVEEILKMVKSINEIISNSETELLQLSLKITEYADFVNRLKRASQN